MLIILIGQKVFLNNIYLLLRIKVRLPVLLCAVKRVEGDFQLCWMISPNVGQTHCLQITDQSRLLGSDSSVLTLG